MRCFDLRCGWIAGKLICYLKTKDFIIVADNPRRGPRIMRSHFVDESQVVDKEINVVDDKSQVVREDKQALI